MPKLSLHKAVACYGAKGLVRNNEMKSPNKGAECTIKIESKTYRMGRITDKVKSTDILLCVPPFGKSIIRLIHALFDKIFCGQV